jgi:hypothetical protein
MLRKIFAVLAIIAAAFYGFEIILYVIGGVFKIALIAKILLFAVFLSYAYRVLFGKDKE